MLGGILCPMGGCVKMEKLDLILLATYEKKRKIRCGSISAPIVYEIVLFGSQNHAT